MDTIMVDLAVLKIFLVQFQEIGLGVVSDQVVCGYISSHWVAFLNLEWEVVNAVQVKDRGQVH